MTDEAEVPAFCGIPVSEEGGAIVGSGIVDCGCTSCASVCEEDEDVSLSPSEPDPVFRIKMIPRTRTRARAATIAKELFL